MNRCAVCGVENLPGKRFCGDCGVLLPVAPGIAAAKGASGAVRETEYTFKSPSLDGERKIVSALSADIKGSTELMRDLDPEEARAIIDPVLSIMIDSVHRFDGYVAQSTGDGIFALFGAPVAHEDNAQRAVHAAIAMRDGLRRRNEDLKGAGHPGVEVRIGINTGEVVVRMVHTSGHTEYTPVGLPANLAARMQSLAPAGSIVISEDTRRLVEGYFDLRDLGQTEIKGIIGPVNVYEVIGQGALHGHFELAARRGLTKFVGREREIAEMKRAFDLVGAYHGQIVATMAAAGSGKSRLLHEFKARLPSECKVFEAYSVSYGKSSAYLPVLQLLYSYFGIKDNDDTRERRIKIETRLSTLDPALSDVFPYMYMLLGIQDTPDPLAQMDPQVRRKRTLEALKRIILREGLNQSTVVIFEDLHWIDGETQALLDLLADSLTNARVLLMVNYRPEYRHGWTNKTCYSQLRLDALGRESTAEMLSTLLGDDVKLDPLKRLIFERSDGNPFFIEEMVRALFDEGVLVRNGGINVVRSISQLRLPPTVQGILAARIDRLEPEQKDLLQTLSVMGRGSPLALIKKIALLPDGQLEQGLSALQAGEFIYEQPAGIEIEYTFNHALTQEVVYNSLLTERRKLLHERAGAAMESLYAGRLDDHLAELARHYQRSRNTGKALEYLRLAGQQTARRSAHREAIGLFRSALELLKTVPESREGMQEELVLQLGLGMQLQVTVGWTAQEVGKIYTRARELCRLLGDPPQLFHVLAGLQVFYQNCGELSMAIELTPQLLAIAERHEDPALLIRTQSIHAISLFWLAEFANSEVHFERASSLYDSTQRRSFASTTGVDPGVLSRSYEIWTRWLLGYPDQAARKIEATLTLARDVSRPFSLALGLLFAAAGYLFRGEQDLARELVDESYSLSTELGFQNWLGHVISWRGASLAERGMPEEGVGQLREGLAAMRASGQELGRTCYLSLLAGACAKGVHAEEGLQAVEEALESLKKTGERAWEAELYRLKGELSLKSSLHIPVSNAEDEAESCFRRAVDIAARQQAKSWELRAATSLARLLARKGGHSRREEARRTIAEVYSKFTEGFDTADLKEATALLSELSRSSFTEC